MQHSAVGDKSEPLHIKLLPITPQLNSQVQDTQLTCDVLIVGAGATGVFLARDLASSGKTVVLVEKANRIGGVWRNNDYYGLFLHQYGVRTN